MSLRKRKMHNLNRYHFLVVSFVSFFLPIVQAEPVSAPNESFEYYNFVGQIKIRSVNFENASVYRQTEAIQYMGVPLDAEVLEVLRKTDGVDLSKLLAPVKSVVNGVCYGNPDIIEGKYAVSNVVAIAGNVVSNGANWCVVEWLLSDEVWKKYKTQKETGIIKHEVSEEEQELERYLWAVHKSAELWEQVKEGEITFEEYKILAAPYSEILDHPVAVTIF